MQKGSLPTPAGKMPTQRTRERTARHTEDVREFKSGVMIRYVKKDVLANFTEKGVVI
jgi:hypothetical protein